MTVAAPLRIEALAVRGRRVGMRARRLPPAPVLLAGVAGAVVPGLRPGDLVVADAVLLLPATTPALGGPPVGDPPGRSAGALTGRRSSGLAVGAPAGELTGRRPSGLAVGAPELAARLRAVGLTVHVGAVAGVDRLVTGPARVPYAQAGALAVDLESAVLARAGRLLAVVRAIVDTPVHPLVSPGTVPRGIAALRSLRRAAPVLHAWVDGPGDESARERQAAHADTTSHPAGEGRATQ